MNDKLVVEIEGEILEIECEVEKKSDGFHTFADLYQHRNLLFIALMMSNPDISWRANVHNDGGHYEGFFIAGMHLPTGDISYHLPVEMWNLLDSKNIRTSQRSPKWDGHSPSDVLDRLARFIK